MSTPTTSDPSGVPRRPEVEAVLRATIDLGSAADAIADAAAHALGVNRTDMRLMAMVRRHRRLPTTRLAALAGLSSAATTTAVRRLVTAGYVEQSSDPADGRRVLVSLTGQAHDALALLYGPVIEQGRRYLDASSTAELDRTERVMREAERLMLTQAAALAVGPPDPHRRVSRGAGADRARD